MSDQHPQPQVVVQPSSGVAGVATTAIDALKTSPTLLLIVLRNMVFAACGTWFLINLENHRAHDRSLLIGMIEKCILQTTPLEQRKSEYQPFPGPQDDKEKPDGHAN